MEISPCPRDGPACKIKWNHLIPDYKKIPDYLSRTGRNSRDYWELSASERKTNGLPRLFAQDVYNAIHEWFSNCLQIQPPHVRDLLSNNDGNFRLAYHDTQHERDEVQSEPKTEDPDDMTPLDHVETTQESSPPQVQRRTAYTISRPTAQADPTTSPMMRPFTCVSPGIALQVINSSDNSQYAAHRRPENTVVRRKNLS